jgi:hypothetical protein
MSISTIISKVRNVIQENSITDSDIFIYDASSVFRLSDENVVAISHVYKNDVELSESANWSYSSLTNRITFICSLTSGDVLEVEYTKYPNYSDTEITSFIKLALYHLSVNSYSTFEVNSDDINPEPEEREENLIALITGVLIKPNNITYRLPDLSISPANKYSTEDMIRQVIASFKRDTSGIFTNIDHNKYV